jgi:hypothetical protein
MHSVLAMLQPRSEFEDSQNARNSRFDTTVRGGLAYGNQATHKNVNRAHKRQVRYE